MDSIPVYTFLSTVMLPAHPESVRDGASRQLKLIFHSVPIHPRLKGGAFSAHTGNRIDAL